MKIKRYAFVALMVIGIVLGNVISVAAEKYPPPKDIPEGRMIIINDWDLQ
jgi:hypothetical protein